MGYNPSDLHGISRINLLITGVISHLLSGMSHQVTIEGGAPCITIAEFVNITPITWVYGRYMEVS